MAEFLLTLVVANRRSKESQTRTECCLQPHAIVYTEVLETSDIRTNRPGRRTKTTILQIPQQLPGPFPVRRRLRDLRSRSDDSLVLAYRPHLGHGSKRPKSGNERRNQKQRSGLQSLGFPQVYLRRHRQILPLRSPPLPRIPPRLEHPKNLPRPHPAAGGAAAVRPRPPNPIRTQIHGPQLHLGASNPLCFPIGVHRRESAAK